MLRYIVETMKIAHKKALGKKQKILIVIVLLLVVAGGIAVFYFYNTQRNNNTTANAPRPVNSVDYSPPTAEQEQSTSTQKDEIINNYNKGQSGSDQNTTSSIAVTISRANQTSAGLSVGTIIDGAKSGTCNVALSRAGQPTISKTFTIAYEATSGFCQEAVIPIGEITSSGEWQLIVTASSGGKTSQAATQTVSINKP